MLSVSPRVSTQTYRAASARLAALSPAWAVLLDRARDEELPEDETVAEQPRILVSSATLGRAVRRYAPDVSEAAVDTLWTYASGLSDSWLLATDVALRRALNPFEALATYPLGAFFQPAQVAWLRAADTRHDPVVLSPRAWQPNHDMDYSGYACTIVKFTRLCNLRCAYCHDWRAGHDQVMPFDVQARLFQKLLGLADHRVLDIVWHGGESTMIGRRGFVRVMVLERWFQRPGQRIRNRIQTNATRIDAAWVRFLQRYDFRVGVSLDGPAEIHDRTRPHVSGRSTFAEARRGLRLLRDAGLLEHVYLVISPQLLQLGAAQVVRFLQEEGISATGMMPVRPGGRREAPPREELPDPFYLDRPTYVQFLLDVHRARTDNPRPWLAVRELDAALRAVNGEPPGFCELLGNCVGAFFSIDPDGRVSHCDKYLGDSNYVLGNLFDHDFSTLRASDRARRLAAVQAPGTESCKYFAYCRGWCPFEQYSAQRFDPDAPTDCCGLAPLFEALSS